MPRRVGRTLRERLGSFGFQPQRECVHDPETESRKPHRTDLPTTSLVHDLAVLADLVPVGPESVVDEFKAHLIAPRHEMRLSNIAALRKVALVDLGVVT